jgi:dephospho-CoA kinase
VDADAIVHALFAPGSDTTADIAARFGTGVLRADGRVDRKALGDLAFADAAARRDLEAIVHPRVYERIAGWTAAQAEAGVRWMLADIPLLFETGRAAEFDRVIVAACPQEEQVRRLVRRDRLGEADALARLAAQWPIAEKVRLATDVVDTSGTFDETDRRVDEVCREIDARAAAGGTGSRRIAPVLAPFGL